MINISRNFTKLIPRNCINPALYCQNRSKPEELLYNLDDEICETYFNKVLILGINIPDAKNSLTHGALVKLNEKLQHFNESDEYSVAVLHGFHGNFCTGIQNSEDRPIAEEVIKTLHNLKKPTVASISGYAIFFGFQLAMMCDLRVMENNALIGAGSKKEKDELFPLVSGRLISFYSRAAALDIMLTGVCYNCKSATDLGLINRIADCGTGIGVAVKTATSIAKYPLEDIFETRKLIFSHLNTMKLKSS